MQKEKFFCQKISLSNVMRIRVNDTCKAPSIKTQEYVWVHVCVSSTTLLSHGLLLLSRFSRVRLCATPQTAAQQAPPSLEFSRQEHWSGLPFPSPMHESESEVSQSCPTPSDPMYCSLPGSSVHGIFQARVQSGLPLPSHMDHNSLKQH